MSGPSDHENPYYRRPDYGPNPFAAGPTDYDAVPWYRKNGICSACVIAHVIVMVLGCCVPLVSLLGVFTTIGVIAVCIVVLTGPVYYNKRNKNGLLKTWSNLNKVAAVILLLLFVGGYGYLIYYLVAHSKFG